MSIMTFNAPWWVADVPYGWRVNQDEDCVTFSPNDGSYFLQISAAQKNGPDITEIDLMEFAGSLHHRKESLNPLKTPHCQGLSFVNADGGAVRYEWWLYSGQVLIYVTCSSANEMNPLERNCVDQIVCSIRSRILPKE